jgi:hypothetical protein
MAVSFTSEAAAREGEPKEPPPELKVQMEEMAALSVGEPEFLDLRPWLSASTLRWTRPAWGADILVGLGEAGERLTLPLTVGSDLTLCGSGPRPVLSPTA